MQESKQATEREVAIARVLRPLGAGPMRRDQAMRAGELLGVHWTTVYRLRTRFLRDPVTSSLTPGERGRRPDLSRLDPKVETVISDVLSQRMHAHDDVRAPALKELAHKSNRARLKKLTGLRAQAIQEPEIVFHPVLLVAQQPVVKGHHLRREVA